MKESILLIGTGALSTLFAARLSEAGHHVSMLGTWKDGLQALNQHGARVSDVNGRERAFQVHATDNPSDLSDIKHAIVLVKSWQTKRVAEKLKGILSPDGIVLTLQNGLGNRETLARDLGVGRVALGVTTTGATLLGPGVVKVGGEGVISLEQNQALGPLEAALRSSNFNLQIVDDARSLIWGKLIINAAINPLTALLRVPNGELLSHPWARKAMSALAREAAEVAAAENVNLPFNDPINAVEEVARKTARNLSSMFQDVRRGAPTEIDAICGAVARRGEEHGVSTPYNLACWQLVSAI
ncbi:MAG TPA: 2-dehydropantoate 2-reductase [Anaerolineales bacterium]|nr:2-dehydropantoate 2-reductase [Anaerolineales bacterium]HNA90113.1 2-dehydropantoate 2-reductase [Anaerolineales bacterium]HNB37447.1 2-dehydropantoate 2-reductase [Anaerolineales bacterium]HNC08754.1 2-dehydropantoate 2-reductase [Anaerolineales bacterium]